MNTDIEKANCSFCKQNVVLTDEGVFGRHRLPAPRINGKIIIRNHQMVLGNWCEGSGKKREEQK